MWWIFGLINAIVVLFVLWLYNCKIKENSVWFKDNKVALITMLIFAFLGGFVVTVLFVGLLVYLIIDFIRYIKN